MLNLFPRASAELHNYIGYELISEIFVIRVAVSETWTKIINVACWRRRSGVFSSPSPSPVPF